MRALIVDVELDIGKVDDIQADRSRVFRNKLREINDLLFCALARIRRRMEIGRIDGHAALCDHPACNRAVDSAG